MKNLWLGSIILFCMVLSQCTTTKVSTNTWRESVVDTIGIGSHFHGSNTSVRYKTDVNIYGRKFSGILFFKFRDDTTCHVAFTTIPGTKLFEMQLTPKTDTIYECFDKMNRPAVLKGIKKNIRTFIMLDDYVTAAKGFTHSDFKGVMWRRYTSTEVYQFHQPEGMPVNKIELLSKDFYKRIVVDILAFNGRVPADIKIHNHNYRLDLHLTQL